MMGRGAQARFDRHYVTAIAICVAILATGCDKVPLLAPTSSTISLTAGTRVLPVNGTTELTAFVVESSGTPVQNGTTVRFTTTLGRVEPAEAQTRNGSVTATFFAGTSSGVAEVRALSGAAGGGSTGTGTGGTGTTTAPNLVQITIGAAAVNTVTLRANPGTVGPNGGPVELIATVVSESGNALRGIPVTFNADKGTLSVQTVPTDTNGEARTVLNTAEKTSVTATAGTKTSTAVTVDVRTGPGVSVTCTPATGTGTNCAAVQASSSNNTATVVFTVSKGTGTSNLRDVTINFGDGTTQSLGTLAGGSATVSHTYSGPSGSSPVTYIATVRATDVNGEVSSPSINVTVTPQSRLTVDLTADTSAAAVPNVGKTATFTATVTGGDPQSFAWDFGDGDTATTPSNKTTHVYRANGQKTATVTVTTTDGRTATGRVEFIVSGI
jgi:hypothetical protein